MKNFFFAFFAGAFCCLGFAPFGFFPIPVLALAVLFYLWHGADTAKSAACLGYVFGLGLFVAGIGWLYVALHDYGGMPMWLSALATLLFAGFWAVFPALAGYLQARLPSGKTVRLVLLMPAMWVLVEWLRGMAFTGFPWLTLGYAQSNSSLAGFAPLLGVYGVSLLAALSAGLLVASCLCVLRPWLLSGLALIWLGGWGLHAVSWTQAVGAPVSVALLQGNIAQDIKFREDALAATLDTYRNMILQNPAQLTILPESALPLLREQVPSSFLEQLQQHAQKQQGDIVFGSFMREQDRYFNSVFTLGRAPEQHYQKQHLVPFGEFIPLRALLGSFINDVLNIPMGDLGRGAEVQAPLQIAGQQVAVNICYEDVFGEEIIRNAAAATLLVNVTNDAWYGDSPAAAQHNQISQFRALETGRMMLRATNTGLTSIIDPKGNVVQQLAQHQQAVLRGNAQGYSGATPYMRWGNSAVVMLALLMLGVAVRRR